ncbi:hypothetical protein CHUAL_006651 [Chamberlinius hualienensis]
MTNVTKLKVVVLGSGQVGKSAVTVRYLTKRYIGEYSSNKDFVYRHVVTIDETTNDVEILDTSRCQSFGCLHEHIQWGDAFVVVYSICDRESFLSAKDFLEKIHKVKVPRFVPIILLGNKRDLDHSRQVAVDDGHELSLSYGCQFYEVSAADNYVGVSLGFHSVLREARSVQLLRTIPFRRRLGVMTVSKMIGMVFGKGGKSPRGNGKKRPSLSI